jgi:hypothetical protein
MKRSDHLRDHLSYIMDFELNYKYLIDTSYAHQHHGSYRLTQSQVKLNHIQQLLISKKTNKFDASNMQCKV